jgi:predicted Kef-type K+ transport protein
VKPVVVDFVPAVAILAVAVALGFGLAAYFDFAVSAGLVVRFALVAAASVVEPAAVALYLYLDDLVAVRK